jgi:antitoxin YefM
MYALYRLRADELDQRFLDALKSQFGGREIEIAVCELVESAEDETAYLLRSPANRKRLMRAIKNVEKWRDRR